MREINKTCYLKGDFVNSAVKHIIETSFYEMENIYDWSWTFKKMIFLEMLNGNGEQEKKLLEDFSEIWTIANREEHQKQILILPQQFHSEEEEEEEEEVEGSSTAMTTTNQR